MGLLPRSVRWRDRPNITIHRIYGGAPAGNTWGHVDLVGAPVDHEPVDFRRRAIRSASPAIDLGPHHAFRDRTRDQQVIDATSQRHPNESRLLFSPHQAVQFDAVARSRAARSEMTRDNSPPEPSSSRDPGGSPAPGSDAFFAQVYDELRAIAHSRMRREQAGQTWQSTELVHEAYLRLTQGKDVAWNSRGHFFTAAAEAMRRILIERARARGRVKRGGDPGGKPAAKVPLDLEEVARLADDSDPEAILALDRALERLALVDARAAQVVKLRFYAGLTGDEVAEALDISRRTVIREWELARIWLYKQLAADTGTDGPPEKQAR
jgi:RNA polymerase sigma factor (TIGR02999 family)